MPPDCTRLQQSAEAMSQSGVWRPLKSAKTMEGKSMKKDRKRVPAEITLRILCVRGTKKASCPCFYTARETSRFSSTNLQRPS